MKPTMVTRLHGSPLPTLSPPSPPPPTPADLRTRTSRRPCERHTPCFLQPQPPTPCFRPHEPSLMTPMGSTANEDRRSVSRLPAAATLKAECPATSNSSPRPCRHRHHHHHRSVTARRGSAVVVSPLLARTGCTRVLSGILDHWARTTSPAHRPTRTTPPSNPPRSRLKRR